MTISVWFDGDETLWDRRGYMLTGLLEQGARAGGRSDEREPELFADVLPTMVGLSETGTVNLIDYAPMPEGHECLLPPFKARVDGPHAPSNAAPELHTTENHLNWIETLDRIESVVAETGKPVDHIVLISNNVAAFDLAAERGWLTVWLNRDRVANLSDVMPSAEIHSLLDLPEVLEAIEEARAAVADLDPEPTAPA
ncbi:MULTISPECIES: hypothetical protein [Dermacoccus]|nr:MULTISPECIES: hypothetical protein [Dermacoccus]QNK53509.1 hypothetical protein H7F30_04170 [Dermacoccus sp. PAMC28757]